jgi:hypothetical protein
MGPPHPTGLATSARSVEHAGADGTAPSHDPAHAPSVERLTTLAWFVLPLSLCPFVALLRPGSERLAMARAEWLFAWQRSVGIAVEPAIHQWFSARPVTLALLTTFYFSAHLSALIATACWLAARHPAGFVSFRRSFAVAQVLTVVTYLAVPVAPLRMVLDDGSGPGDGGWARSIQYEFAAVPSGHVVFALVVAGAVWRCAPARWRWLAVAHPAGTALVVVGTAHHSLVDVAAGAFVVVVARAVVAVTGIDPRSPAVGAHVRR